jgi:hypothetical protein
MKTEQFNIPVRTTDDTSVRVPILVNSTRRKTGASAGYYLILLRQHYTVSNRRAWLRESLSHNCNNPDICP